MKFYSLAYSAVIQVSFCVKVSVENAPFSTNLQFYCSAGKCAVKVQRQLDACPHRARTAHNRSGSGGEEDPSVTGANECKLMRTAVLLLARTAQTFNRCIGEFGQSCSQGSPYTSSTY